MTYQEAHDINTLTNVTILRMRREAYQVPNTTLPKYVAATLLSIRPTQYNPTEQQHITTQAIKNLHHDAKNDPNDPWVKTYQHLIHNPL